MSELMEKPKRKLWKRIVGGLAKTVVVLVVLALIARSIINYVAARKMQTAISQIEADGDPVTFDDLDALMPKVDARQDAGRLYDAATVLLLEFDRQKYMDIFHDAMDSWPIKKPADSILNEIETVLHDNHRVFELVDEGAAISNCRYDLQAQHGFDKALKTLSRFRYAAQLISLRTRYLAFQGETEQAVDSAVASLAFPRAFDRQPIIIAYLVQSAIESLACADVIDLLEIAQLDDASLRKLQNAINRIDRIEMLGKSLRADRVVAIGMYRNTFIPSGFSNQMGIYATPGSAYLIAGQLEDQRNYIKAADQPWPKAFEDIKAYKPQSLFGANLAGSLTSVAQQTGRKITTTRATLTAVMIERYRLANAEYPKSLQQLVPQYTDAVPVDPFTGKELLYRLNEDSYTVYGVGENCKDDGGDILDHKKSLDWGVRVRVNHGE